MDSGNSGSISSSGDEEYDESRSDHHQNQQIPSFLNPTTTHFGSSDPQSTSDPSHLLSHHSLFDHLQQQPSNPNNNNNNNNTSNFFLNLDTNTSTLRSRSDFFRSDNNPYNNLGLINHHHQQQQHSSSSLLLQPSHQNFPVVTVTTTTPSSSPIQTQNQPHNLISNEKVTGSAFAPSSTAGALKPSGSKKRTRASRRAPTTVLTTDTSNFRAMVQEFTGIPAPPFSSSSPFSRRFDLFGAGSSGITRSLNNLDAPLYPNLVRPSPIKPCQPQNTATNSTTINNAMVDATSSSSLNYSPQMIMRSSNMLGIGNTMQNQQLHNQHGFNNMGFHVASLPSSLNFPNNKMAHQDLALDHHHHHHMNVGPGYGGGSVQGQLSQGSGSDANQQNVWRAEGATESSSKMINSDNNSSEFHGEKSGGLEINVVSTRVDQGTVDSWIFPSD